MYKGEKHDDRSIINNTFVCEKVDFVENFGCLELRMKIDIHEWSITDASLIIIWQ